MRRVYTNEPLSDFTDEATREKMLQALADVDSKMGKEYPLIIGGKRVYKDDKIISLDPSNKSVMVGLVSKAGKEDIDEAIETATKAFNCWKNYDLRARAAILYRTAALMRKRRYELVAWVIRESGRNWGDADYDVAFTIDHLEYYGRMTEQIQENKDLLPVGDNEDNRMIYIPLGVGAVIPPWNFALGLMTGMVAAAVVAGNAVLIKPSSLTPVASAIMMEIWQASGVPEGVINFVPGDGSEIGDYIVTHPQIRFIAFTGSKDVGLRINRLAAQTSEGQKWIKRVVLEMGGKDAILVDGQVDDLDKVADGIVSAAYGYQGQKCAACSRAIIHEKVYDDLAAKLVERTEKITVGPATENFGMGPLVDINAYNKVLKYIEIGKSEGDLLCGGVTGSNSGYFIYPTIFGNIDPHARLAQEEIFGPVLSLIKVKDFEEGVEVFNNTEYGLTGSFYSSNRDHLEIARRELHCGNLNLNSDCTYSMVGANPFGGFNMSGTDSKTGSPDYLLLFVQAKTITELF